MAGELLQAHFQFWCIASAHTLISALPPIKHLPPGAKISNKRPSQMYPPPLPFNLLSCRYVQLYKESLFLYCPLIHNFLSFNFNIFILHVYWHICE